MIEVMVTIVVVAFGLLGLASLVLRGLQAGADSQFRTLAIKQTYDMADRMRGNPVDAKADKYDGILPSGSPSCSSLLSTIQGGGIPLVTTSSTTPPACSGTGFAFDGSCWQRANMTELPKGAGAVCKGAGANWYAVIVSWDENRSGTANKSFWITFEP